ncbi:MAG: ISAs1 family transposase [Desulfobacter sp.]|nr:MAG: ISAs1 family transposase [Desulfobacter sp.]
MQDPRHHNKLHNLIDVVIIAICAVVAGADTYEQIENFGKKRKRWLSKFLSLPHGIPSHDTFGRIFERMNPNEFQSSFMHWVQSVAKMTKGQVIAIDGKTLRRSHDTSNDKKAIHMISAWASSNKVVLGQLKTEEKSNEIRECSEFCVTVSVPGSASAPAEVKVRSENGPSISHVGGVDFCWSGVPGTIFSICK